MHIHIWILHLAPHVGNDTLGYCSEVPKDDWTRWPNSKGKTLGLTTRGTDSFAKYLGPRTGGISAAPIFEWFFYVLLPSQNPVETCFTIGKKAIFSWVFCNNLENLCLYCESHLRSMGGSNVFTLGDSESSTFLVFHFSVFSAGMERHCFCSSALRTGLNPERLEATKRKLKHWMCTGHNLQKGHESLPIFGKFWSLFAYLYNFWKPMSVHFPMAGVFAAAQM